MRVTSTVKGPMKGAMKGTMKGTVLMLSCLGILLPPSAIMAAQPASGHKPPAVDDTALGPGGALRGVVVDSQGTPVPAAGVLLTQGRRRIAMATTDARGHFAMTDLRGGLYVLSTDRAAKACRLWAPDTGPPSAGQGVLIVSDGGAVRGQFGDFDLYTWASEHYVLTYTAIAVAIAVPVAVIAANQKKSPASP